VFDNDTIVFTRTAPCSAEQIVRQYRVDLNLAVPKRNVSQAHIVCGTEAGNDRDDNAFNEIEPNWLE
jgi:hypothetical protein